jgi:hypothetical protein
MISEAYVVACIGARLLSQACCSLNEDTVELFLLAICHLGCSQDHNWVFRLLQGIC